MESVLCGEKWEYAGSVWCGGERVESCGESGELVVRVGSSWREWCNERTGRVG